MDVIHDVIHVRVVGGSGQPFGAIQRRGNGVRLRRRHTAGVNFVSTMNRTKRQLIYDGFDQLIDEVEQYALRNAKYHAVADMLRQQRDNLP